MSLSNWFEKVWNIGPVLILIFVFGYSRRRATKKIRDRQQKILIKAVKAKQEVEREITNYSDDAVYNSLRKWMRD